MHNMSPSELRCREVYNDSEGRRELEEAATMRVYVVLGKIEQSVVLGCWWGVELMADQCKTFCL